MTALSLNDGQDWTSFRNGLLGWIVVSEVALLGKRRKKGVKQEGSFTPQGGFAGRCLFSMLRSWCPFTQNQGRGRHAPSEHGLASLASDLLRWSRLDRRAGDEARRNWGAARGVRGQLEVLLSIVLYIITHLAFVNIFLTKKQDIF